MAAALDPLFGTRSLEEVSLLGWAVLAPLLFLFLRTTFTKLISLATAVFSTLVPPLLLLAQQPRVDTWGLSLLIAGLLVAALAMQRGLRWLPAWIGTVLVLSFTRDLTIVLVAAIGWVAVQERSRRALVLTTSGALAALPALLIFPVSIQQNLAYVINDFHIPTDTSWSFILSHYPHEIAYTIGNDLTYPFTSQLPVLSCLMTIPVLAAFFSLFAPGHRLDTLVGLGRGVALGAFVTVLVAANYTELRLELAFIPAIAVGLALLGSRRLELEPESPRADPARQPL
jgi:hypothetical protein